MDDYKIIQDSLGVFEQGFYIVVNVKEKYMLASFEFKKEAEKFLKELRTKGGN